MTSYTFGKIPFKFCFVGFQNVYSFATLEEILKSCNNFLKWYHGHLKLKTNWAQKSLTRVILVQFQKKNLLKNYESGFQNLAKPVGLANTPLNMPIQVPWYNLSMQIDRPHYLFGKNCWLLNSCVSAMARNAYILIWRE